MAGNGEEEVAALRGTEVLGPFGEGSSTEGGGVGESLRMRGKGKEHLPNELKRPQLPGSILGGPIRGILGGR